VSAVDITRFAATPRVRAALRVQFTHGLGDCAFFAHQLPLYVRRGYAIAVVCTPDKHIVFADSGVGVATDTTGAAAVPWHEGLIPAQDADLANCWRWSKGGRNISVPPMPNIGSPKDLWDEYRAIKLDVTPHLPAESRLAASRWLAPLPKPVVLLHSHGNTGPERKNLEAQKCKRLYQRLLDDTGGTVVLLDWDNRVPRLAHGRVRHLADDWAHIDTATLLGVMSQADLLIGVDSGPLHIARLVDLPAIGVWAHAGSPVTWTLPHPRQLNVVLTQERPAWYGRSRASYHTIALSDDESAMEPLAALAHRMLEKPRYLDRTHIAADVQLQWFVRSQMRGGDSPFGGYVDRHLSFDLVLRELSARSVQPCVVETGCIRAEDDFAGAGFSTYVIGFYLSRHGGRLISVDNDPMNCAFARVWTRCFGAAVEIRLADSIAFLRDSREPIDLLYLDSLDADHARCAEHSLAEIQAAYPRLRGRSLVVCDDTPYSVGQFRGKGALAVPWLLERGWRILYTGHQTVLSL